MATASFLMLGALLTAGAGASEVIGPPLADPHVGTPLSTPPPPLVNGEAPDFVQYRWERCRRYSLMVGLDRPTGVWHLDHDVADGAIHQPQNGYARRFDGIDDSLALSSDPDISGTRPYTIELWVRPSFAVDGRYRFLISREATDARGRQGTGIWFTRSALGFERWTDGVKAGVTFNARIESGKWTLVTATYDGTQMRLFVMAKLIGSRVTTAPLAPNGAPFQLGAGYGGRSGFFNGDLDELALYDRALTRSHVGAHGWAGVSLPCVQIPNADGATYTPALEELGTTLKSVTNSTRSLPTGDVTVSSISESMSPADDPTGQLVRPLILTPSEGETVAGTTLLTAAVAGTPMIDRIEFLVDGAVRYAKGEAPYQYAWNTTGAVNGTHTVAVRVWGPGSSTPVTAQRTVSVAN